MNKAYPPLTAKFILSQLNNDNLTLLGPILTEKEHNAEYITFPKITICSASMHSRQDYEFNS